MIALLTATTAAGPPAVTSLNVSQYTGRWYQMYASATVKWSFEVGGNCVTADYAGYGTRADEITVANTVSVLGHNTRVQGYAVANPAHAGELDVVLGAPGHGADPSTAGKFNSTNYLVFGLGPVVDQRYDYALVSDPTGSSLYMLAREISRFHEQYEQKLLEQVKQLGFTGVLNKPRKSNQEGCSYSPPP